ncbi:small glutamine-rich tetratricopeptide repeat-containing protein alpha-like [Oscarella lobularis]|uniref:small glutamine-rich tetratricopeptide repeat-containing protein alpha-like n=1 Tax=Oscarella lobularis TaxID=121494 RepID=UPI0033139EFB
MSESRKRLALAIVRHLQSELNDGLVESDAEDSMQVAIECLSNCYGLDLANAAQMSELVVEKSLTEIFLSATGKSAKPEPAEISEEDKEKAENFKSRGNDLLKNNKLAEALECYTKAIEINPRDTIYFSNRAAVYSKMRNFQQAIEDCRKALEIDPNFGKAYGRLGFAYMNLNDMEKAESSYQKALQLDPENQSYKTCLQVVQQKLASKSSSSSSSSAATAEGAAPPPPPPQAQASPSAAGGFPGLGGMDLGALFNNPAMMSMAQNVMSNPAMMNMAASMFSSMSQGGGGGGGAGGAGGGGMPDLFAMGQQFTEQLQQENPELLDQLKDQFEGGGQGGGAGGGGGGGNPPPPSGGKNQ